jgi:uncharacterized Zn-binding protein involved in type VI secretion
LAVLSQANIVHVVHCNTVDPYDCHAGGPASFSSKVFVEGSPAIRIGDTLTCGDTVAGGASKIVSA